MGNNFLLRSISGIVLVVVLIGSILWCDLSKFAVLAVIALFTISEILTLVAKYKNVKLLYNGYFAIASSVLLLITYHYAYYIFGAVVVLLALVRLCYELYRKSDKPLESVGYEMVVMSYVLFPIMLLVSLPTNIVITIFILVWTNDVGAYLVGCTLGKRRLFERISPKKSWEGFWGGFALVVLVSALIAYYWLSAPVIYCMIAGAVISIAAVYGDLFESLMKRTMGVKDSGNSIPGHGGFWDRFDALFFAVPAYYIVMEIIPLLIN